MRGVLRVTSVHPIVREHLDALHEPTAASWAQAEHLKAAVRCMQREGED
ncbi:MAG TPA: hypothetical protein VGQ83_02385 [Polyangia bacterium]|jgi:mannose/cellobiose epimerase-like protein (N-acyl-D-glucosamine 2-epimerase family)